jgi:hypothetical protein
MSTLSVVKPNAFDSTMIVSSTIPMYEIPEWGAGSTYAIDEQCTYGLRVYQSTADANIGKNPLTDTTIPAWWVDVGPSNYWACFDTQTTTQMVASESVTLVVTPGRFDTFALVNARVTSVHLKIESVVDGVVYDQEHVLGNIEPVLDWYGYFFAPIGKPTELVVSGLAQLGDALVTITLNAPGGVVALGTMVFGMLSEIGSVKYGAGIGVIDYSRKDTDEYGTTTFVQRAFSNRITLPIDIKSNRVDAVYRLIAALRATPCLWVGADGIYGVLTVFGFYRDFSLDIQYPTYSSASLTIEGLT